jgi:hypothetical protein
MGGDITANINRHLADQYLLLIELSNPALENPSACFAVLLSITT